ncbi:WYL domain-containing protein [Spirillospora sp. NPDC048911]|uniref:WYL domain-containing protein n=1 Tax=Spirillospora sp. NPDC048911 TaxID=3364527 RepID=UPI003719A3D0
MRAAEPHRLVHSGRRWYLVGWDIDREDWRTYRVDRLRLRTPNGPRFVPRDPPDEDVAAYTSRAIASSPYRYQGVFTVHASAGAVAGRIPPTMGAVEPIDERTCTLRCGAHTLDELAVWVALTGLRFEVHEPPELVDRIAVLADRLADAAAGAVRRAEDAATGGDGSNGGEVSRGR